MDIYQVMIGLSKNPENYVEEYRQQLRSFEALVKLPKQPEKIIRQTLSFLLTYPKVDSQLSEILIASLKTIKCHKIRGIIVGSLFILKHKGLIGIEQLFKSLLEHCTDLKSVLNKAKKEASEEAIPQLLSYYRKGTDKQRCFCYYLIVCLFSRGHTELEDEVCSGLFAEGRVGRICMLYFLDQIDFEEEVGGKVMSLLSDNGAKFGKLLFKEISESKMERDLKVTKMRIYVLFRARYGLKASIIPIAMNMLNPEKEDVKDLIGVIVGSVMDGDVLKVIDVVSDALCSEFRDDDFIVYGLNILREIYCKFDPRIVKPKVTDNGSSDLEEFSEDSDVSGDCSDSDAGSINEEKMEEDPLLSKIKDKILNYIECFKGSKAKSVYYAYSSVVNAIRHKKYLDRAPEYIRKKATKEERAHSRKAGRVEKERQKKYTGGKHSKRRKVGKKKASKGK